MWALKLACGIAQTQQQMLTAYVKILEDYTDSEYRTHVFYMPANGPFNNPENMMAWAFGIMAVFSAHPWFAVPGMSSPFTLISLLEISKAVPK